MDRGSTPLVSTNKNISIKDKIGETLNVRKNKFARRRKKLKKKKKKN